MQLGRDWNFFSYTYGEVPRQALVRFDIERAILPCPPSHQTCRRLVMCDAEAEALAAFEAELPTLLSGVDCMLVGVLRYANTEDLVFQVEDMPGFTNRHQDLIGRAPVAIDFHDSPGWDFFIDRVTPNEADWQRIGDRESIERHVASGADPQGNHKLEHAFIGDRIELDHIRDRLLVEGFEVCTLDEKRMVLARHQALESAEISTVTVALARFSRSRGVVYDGWKRTE